MHLGACPLYLERGTHCIVVLTTASWITSKKTLHLVRSQTAKIFAVEPRTYLTPTLPHLSAAFIFESVRSFAESAANAGNLLSAGATSSAL